MGATSDHNISWITYLIAYLVHLAESGVSHPAQATLPLRKDTPTVSEDLILQKTVTTTMYAAANVVYLILASRSVPARPGSLQCRRARPSAPPALACMDTAAGAVGDSMDSRPDEQPLRVDERGVDGATTAHARQPPLPHETLVALGRTFRGLSASGRRARSGERMTAWAGRLASFRT